MLKYIPMLFSTPMVQAIMDDRKTKTRRTVKGIQPGADYKCTLKETQGIYSFYQPEELDRPYDARVITEVKAPYKSGDVIWVRETYFPMFVKGCFEQYKLNYPERPLFIYKTEVKKPPMGFSWKPSLLMPKIACRTFLEITKVSIEKLQNVSEEDAIAEGVIQYEADTDWLTAQYGFKMLWEQINGKDSWRENPWVWVITFKPIAKPEVWPC
jgi:hypothetical protein